MAETKPTPPPRPPPTPTPTPITAPPTPTTELAACSEALKFTVVKLPEEATIINNNNVEENPIKTEPKTARTRSKRGQVSSITTFVLSLPILASVIWLLYMKDYECEQILKLPDFQFKIGIGMIVVFVVSNIAVLLKSKLPVLGFFVIMVLLILKLIVGLALVGAYKLQSKEILASPVWFNEQVHDDQSWQNIKSCIYNSKTCEALDAKSLNLGSYAFSIKQLSSIEAGCCKPPTTCQMEYVNATFWRRRDEDLALNNHTTNQPQKFNIGDCNAWDNGRKVLCYDCETCKQGFVSVLESKWWKLGVFLISMAFLLIVSHLFLFVVTMLERHHGQ